MPFLECRFLDSIRYEGNKRFPTGHRAGSGKCEEKPLTAPWVSNNFIQSLDREKLENHWPLQF
ncbi:MAG: hypothetical protein DME22_25155 [Verrucomicrobia bacterium]|nr:MAG: hypothetical protein DME22_25155 [Verrucomicrobiota bacterium]